MHKLSFILVLCLGLLAIGANSFAQPGEYNGGKYGVGILYSSENIITCSLDLNGWIIGLYGKNWDSAEVREANTSNYGRTYIGKADQEVYGLDVGYSWKPTTYLRIGMEGSIAHRTEYDKYRDYRFTESYYLVETDSETVLGVGAIACIPVHKRIELTVEAHSIKGFSGGIIFRW